MTLCTRVIAFDAWPLATCSVLLTLVASLFVHQLFCTLPSGQGSSQQVQVRVGTQSSNLTFFSYNGPTISSVTPSTGPTAGGTTLRINGTSFGSSGSFTIGGAACVIVPGTYTDTSVQCTLPAGEGTALVQAVISSSPSNTQPFVYASPVLSSITPSTGPTGGGSSIVLNGTNFGLSSTVTVGGSGCAVTARSHNSLTCTLPAGAGLNVTTTVTVTGQSASRNTFSYAAPTISSINPSSALSSGGTTLVINGANLGSSGTVTVAGAACSATGAGFQHTSVSCLLPAGEGVFRNVSVNVGGQVVWSTGFNYSAPVISSIQPTSTSTAGGVPITLFGTSFGLNPSVSVGGRTCTIAIGASSHGQIICTVPAGSGSVLAQVTVAGQTSNTFPFTYDSPVVTSISPARGATNGGYPVTVSGNSFDVQGAASRVTIGGQVCTISVWNHSSITCNVAAGSGIDKAVVVRTQASVTSTSPLNVVFRFDAPTISLISPATVSTDGTAIIDIQGTNFGLAGNVTIGSSTCTTVNAGWGHSLIRCQVPAGQGNRQLVTVLVDTQSATSLAFGYLPPTLSSITPNTSSTVGGTLMQVRGLNFGLAPAVTVGSAACVGAPVNSSFFQCTIPEGQGDNIPVQMNAGGQLSNVLLLTYSAPTITSVTPSSGPTFGGSTIVINGTSLGLSGIVSVGGSQCNVQSRSHTSIRCILPAGEGSQSVIVYVDALASNALPFTYTGPTISNVNPLSGGTGGGTTIVVDGSNFGFTGLVTIGGQQCAAVGSPVVFNHSRITCSLPPGSGSTNRVIVTVGSLSSPPFATNFSYNRPHIDSINPNTAGTQGGAILDILGTSFGTSGTVFINGVIAPAFGGAYSHSSIRVLVPEGAGKDLPVTIVSNGLTNDNSPAVLFTYTAPFASSVSPPNGGTIGNTIITILGSNFGPSG